MDETLRQIVARIALLIDETKDSSIELREIRSQYAAIDIYQKVFQQTYSEMMSVLDKSFEKKIGVGMDATKLEIPNTHEKAQNLLIRELEKKLNQQTELIEKQRLKIDLYVDLYEAILDRVMDKVK